MYWYLDLDDGKIVLPNATIVHASERQNFDLYFALRGGMNNFGIVTRYTMRAIPQKLILGGDKTYSSKQKDKIAHEAFELTTTWKNDTDMAFSYGYGYDQESDNFSISFTHAYARPDLHPAPFTHLGTIPYEPSTVRIDRMSDLSIEGASHTPSGSRLVPFHSWKDCCAV